MKKYVIILIVAVIAITALLVKNYAFAVDVVDSYNESNQDAYTSLYNNYCIKIGQSFTGDGSALDSCKFYLKKLGSPTGNATATIYAHTGTFGTDGTPTGSVLATSGNLDVSNLTETLTLTTLTFAGAEKITLANGTKYFVLLEYSGGDNDNNARIGFDVDGTHNGNFARYTDVWTSNSSYDLIFYVYSEEEDGGRQATQIKTGMKINSGKLIIK
ncbi:hypothetical protein KAR28_04370 [Candidatus Parcubacteria bacterium]|nr:hypothetical protein [Candidatus Parcubacteria bacterium]